jgi:hypothetical protein
MRHIVCGWTHWKRSIFPGSAAYAAFIFVRDRRFRPLKNHIRTLSKAECQALKYESRSTTSFTYFFTDNLSSSYIIHSHLSIVLGFFPPAIKKDGDGGSNATSSHPTEMNSLTCQLFWSPSVTCITLSMKMI